MAPKEKLEDIPAPIYEGIGRVVTQWAGVEMLVGQFLSFLVMGDVVLMLTITQNVSSSTVSDWIRTLLPVRIHDPYKLVSLQDLMGHIDDLRGERNLFVHGLWNTSSIDGTAVVQTMRWDRAEIMKVQLVTTADVDDLVYRIEEVFQELLMLGSEFGFHPPPFPEIKVKPDVERS